MYKARPCTSENVGRRLPCGKRRLSSALVPTLSTHVPMFCLLCSLCNLTSFSCDARGANRTHSEVAATLQQTPVWAPSKEHSGRVRDPYHQPSNLPICCECSTYTTTIRLLQTKDKKDVHLFTNQCCS